MARLWIDRDLVGQQLSNFFDKNKQDLSHFGNTVNQTFEAFVFATVVKWYANNGWKVEFKHPKSNKNRVSLKFSTRGRPNNYTYVLCSKDNEKIQIRHQIRVATRAHLAGQVPPANVVLDIAVIDNQDLRKFSTDDYIDNAALITFAEAKHMSAFAELVANFIGLAHELKPEVLGPVRLRVGGITSPDHPAPFLYVSGYLYPTAAGLINTMKDRGYDIDVWDYQTGVYLGTKLPVIPARKRNSMQKLR